MSIIHSDLWNKGASFCIRFRWGMLLLGLFVLLLAIPERNNLQMERRLESMLIEGDSARDDFEFLTTRFGGNEIVLCIFEIPELWSEDGAGLVKLDKIGEQLRKVAGVQDVMDLARLNRMLDAFQPTLLFGSSKQPRLLDKKNLLSEAMLDLFAGYTHLSNRPTTALVCMLDPKRDSEKDLQETIDAIQAIVRSPLPNEKLLFRGDAIGEPILVHDGFRLIEADGKGLGVASTIALSILLLVGFRSFRWTWIAVLVVQWSILVTQACIVWMHLQLTMVSSMLAALVTIIGVATTIHWMMGYQEEYELEPDPRQAIERSLQKLIRPILFACVTDAIGFAALLFARVGPVRDYGLMMAVASMVVLVGILILIPGLATLGWGGYRIHRIPGDQWIRDWLVGSLRVLRQRARWVAGLTAAIVAWSLLGAIRMEVETDFIKNFRSDWPMVQAYDRVEKELGGAGVWDVLLPAPPSLDDRYLSSVRTLEGTLREIDVGNGYRLTKVMSLADAELAAQSAPGAKFLSSSARIGLMQTTMPSFAKAMWSSAKKDESNGWFRIMLRSPERASAKDKLALIHRVEEMTRIWWSSESTHFNNVEPSCKPKVTGHFVLLTHLIESLVADQWRCFLAAAIGVGFAMYVAVGDIRWVFVALVPNAIPSLIVLGTMGWLGWRINLGAALIAAVSMGISIDSSLHYLLRLQRELAVGCSLDEALDRSQREVGMAMLLSTVALMLGFAWLTTSDFLPTVVFGATAVLTMFGGLVGNLWLLPTLIGMLGQSGKATRVGEGLPQG